MPLAAFRNTFAGNPLDRAADRRTDATWLADRLANPESRAHVLWNGSPLVRSDSEALATVAIDLAAELGEDGERLLFLGLGKGDRAVFALDLDGAADPSAGPLQGRGRFTNLRELAAVLSAGEAAIAATAKAVFEWRRRMRFCPACAAPLSSADGGWRQTCTTCGVEQFPRTDPVVIMLPVRGENCLLGRQASWAPGRHSALAGFMEPGESIEEACAREIAEEAGLAVTRVRYHSSQPWPFPTNLMIGLVAEVEAGEARPLDSELESLVWLTRAQALALVEAPVDPWTDGAAGPTEATPTSGVSLPPPLAIARQLIAAWAREEIAI